MGGMIDARSATVHCDVTSLKIPSSGNELTGDTGKLTRSTTDEGTIVNPKDLL